MRIHRPKTCSYGHPSFTYTGAKCAFCWAMNELGRIRSENRALKQRLLDQQRRRDFRYHRAEAQPPEGARRE